MTFRVGIAREKRSEAGIGAQILRGVHFSALQDGLRRPCLRHRRPGPVLVVEDSETDLYLLKRALKAEPPEQELLRARDGEEGIELLDELASGGRRSLPDLIVVDLNLPRVNGHEVLAHLRAQQAFQKIPVIVVTSCEAEAERKKALAGGADGYFVKPFDIASYRRLPEAIAEARRVRAERVSRPHDGRS